MTNSTIHLQRGIERPLRDVDLAELLHLPSASPEAFRLRVRLDCVGFDGLGNGLTDDTRCNDGLVPLICPTCQWLRKMRQASRRQSPVTVHGVVFDILLSGHGSLRPDLISSYFSG
jgi:hypothetical protein